MQLPTDVLGSILQRLDFPFAIKFVSLSFVIHVFRIF